MDPTDYRANPEYHARVRAQMLTLLTRFMAGEIGVIETARALSRYSDLPEPEFRPHLDTFIGIDSDTDALPVGAVRKHWAPEALLREDKKIAAAEDQCRESAQDAASHLIRLIASSS